MKLISLYIGHDYFLCIIQLWSSGCLSDALYCWWLVGTCESFFVRSNRISNRIGHLIRFESNLRIESAVYHASRNTAQRTAGCSRLVQPATGLRNSELSTCLFQFSHKTRQTMLLYAYFTPKVDFKRKFNHHQSFLYEWRLTARTIRKFRIGPSVQIESRIWCTIRNRITKLRRSLMVSLLANLYVYVDNHLFWLFALLCVTNVKFCLDDFVFVIYKIFSGVTLLCLFGCLNFACWKTIFINNRRH